MSFFVNRTNLVVRLESKLIKLLIEDFGSEVTESIYNSLDRLYVKLDEDDYLDILEYMLGKEVDLDYDLHTLIQYIPIPIARD